MRRVVCPECGERVHRGSCSACFWREDQQSKKEVIRPEELAETEIDVDESKAHAPAVVPWGQSILSCT